MSLSFAPQTEQEVLNLLKPGVYDFQVRAAEDTISKKNNPTIKLTLVTWDSSGRERFIKDYLSTSLMYKLKHFCDAVGLEAKYEAGSFGAADCVGKTGKFKLRVEEQDGYAPKNAVQDYVKGGISAPVPVAKEVHEELNDDIPF